MDFSVTLLKNKSKRMFLIEIRDEVTVWSVEKRFSEIYNLKESITELFKYRFNKYPKKRFVHHYRDDVLQNRLDGINTFFLTIGQRKDMYDSQVFQNFIRSNIYLETYENLRQADELRNSFIKSKELELRTQGLLDDCNFLNDEITALQGKNDILIRNIKEIESKNGENLSLFTEAKDLKLKSSREKNNTFMNIIELDTLYYNLRRHIVLVKILKSSSVERLHTLRDKIVELETDLLTINSIVNKIEDPVLTKKFHLDDYKIINNIYQEKIRIQLDNLNLSNNK